MVLLIHMAKKTSSRRAAPKKQEPLVEAPKIPSFPHRIVLGVILVAIGILFVLAGIDAAGPAGRMIYEALSFLVGVAYFLIPLLILAFAVTLMRRPVSEGFPVVRLVGSILLALSLLGIITLLTQPADGTASQDGGIVGMLVATPLVSLFDRIAAFVLLATTLVVALLLSTNIHLLSFKKPEISLFKRSESQSESDEPEEDLPLITGLPEEEETMEDTPPPPPKKEEVPAKKESKGDFTEAPEFTLKGTHGSYVPPPLSLLEKDRGKATTGDIKANANIIRRTMHNFGIQVEMDEVSIGPSVTRYAIKPAEGVRLSKILGLQNNLELALAAHPVRIEAPIPGKSLVGIEVPNTAKTTVGLGTLLGSADFTQSSKHLLIGLGRDITGQAHFTNLAKAPHLLIAGATGSGKSVAIHTLITSLLYRNGPDNLRMIMVDPKRVELTLYNGIPHLLSPVITDPKKAIMALRWAAKEMDRRYNILEQHSVRDIDSYRANVFSKDPENSAPMPYIVVIIDELADIMQAYPRELEASIVRLAQMSRAVGIHLILSTQRPSVNVITGLIKANVPARVALQVASQIDSRTIIDMAGAEKLLGAGDMLFLSSDMAKPYRIQCAFISETEVKNIASFIKEKNAGSLDMLDLSGNAPTADTGMGMSLSLEGDGDDDDLYEAAKEAVLEAGKASTSYLQRKLRIGYSRAARLMDILEERGVIGAADGSKPREVISNSDVED
jgi:S-DNA-T family DNA segregation ATPase FtsK/SpoIIIE